MLNAPTNKRGKSTFQRAKTRDGRHARRRAHQRVHDRRAAEVCVQKARAIIVRRLN